MRVLLDTNILLLHLSENILSSAPKETEFYISTITVAEALRYPGLGDDDIRSLIDLMSIMTPVSVDNSIAQRAGELGRTRSTRLPDLLIAATALEWSFTLITKNIKDFKSIPNLDLRNSIGTPPTQSSK
ncbi:type II toxin-antitoxin system VapC family toxin [Candidatus Uhrbacteria bacterium]|nr:type II toxin-antitoxin system VapC family toxin [Candidatus Uhrbacteria bacterium]